jgi:hypothetical protein
LAACSRISFFASLFGFDFFGPACAELVQFAGKRLELLFDGLELRGGGGAELGGLDEILADG